MGKKKRRWVCSSHKTELTDSVGEWTEFSVEVTDLEDIDEDTIALLSGDVAKKYRCVPIGRAGSLLFVAMAAPPYTQALDELASLTGCEIDVFVAKEQDILKAISRYYGDD